MTDSCGRFVTIWHDLKLCTQTAIVMRQRHPEGKHQSGA
jgi:hypothetical protein